MASEGWSLTESDPAIFTSLLQELGVTGLEVAELYTLDDAALLESLKPLYGLIFLFKYVDAATLSARNASQTADDASTGKPVEDVDFYFAHQVINNACATMALLNAAMNIPTSSISSSPSSSLAADVKLGTELEALKSFSMALDPSSRGWAVSNSEKIREAHNSFARSDPFEHTRDPDDDDREKEDAYHFIAYVPINGTLYELDGLQRHPISHGPIDKDIPDDWLPLAKSVVERRIASYNNESEIAFNLMAICGDQVKLLEKRIEAIRTVGEGVAAGDTGTSLKQDKEIEMMQLQSRLQEELQKRERWQFENSLRRHNHLGLVHALLVALAKEGKLSLAIEESKAVMKSRNEKARERQRLAGQ